MRTSFLLSSLLLLSTGACGVNRVNRAALVPHMTPTLGNGAPMETSAELMLGASSVAHTTLGATDTTAGVEVPGTQAEGQARFRVGRHAAIGLIYAEGFASTAQAIKPNQPPVDGGDTRGYGFTVSGMVPTADPRWHVGLNFEGLTWRVPYVEYSVCVDLCGGVNYSTVDHGVASATQIAVGVVPTYSTERFRAWGGVTLRNHPTIEQKGVELGVDFSNDVEDGSFNLVLSAGLDTALGGSGIRGGLTVYQVAYGAPASYGPSLAAMVTIPLGGRDPAPAH
ncbi:MAG: hypothetical protein R3B06_00710 [Kofleriaceae bacterium]